MAELKTRSQYATLTLEQVKLRLANITRTLDMEIPIDRRLRLLDELSELMVLLKQAKKIESER